MPHLHFEYSAGLETLADLDGLARILRDALVASGQAPLGGVRVRGFRADHQVVADGGAYHFLDMELRLGQGRDAATRGAMADTLYAAAEGALRPALGDIPFILSLEVREIDSRYSRKSWSTIHAAIEAQSS